MTDFKDILGFDLQRDGTRSGLFLASAAALALGYLACRFIVDSRLGRVAVAIRDAEFRTRFLGYRVERIKLWIFSFSAALAGVAGALYVPQVGIINPGEFSPLNSIEPARPVRTPAAPPSASTSTLQSLAGKHTVVVEHDMEFVRAIAKRVTVLHRGRVLAEGTMDEVQNDPKVIEVYLGE